MASHWTTTYPALPDDTRQAASSLYGKGNIYIRIGDHLDELLEGLIPLDTKPSNMMNRSLVATIQYAMLTIFQFVEELSNKQIIEAVRTRVDAKYALHLPMNSPSHDPHDLCEFRKQLFADPPSQQILQNLLVRLVEFGLLKPAPDRPVDVDQLLITVCTLNRLDEVIDAIYQGLEALAVTDPEWLRQITLPHWYERYTPKRRLPLVLFSDDTWKTRSLRMAADIQYLLGEIDKSNNPDLTSLQEIQEIRRIWEEQFVTSAEGTGNRIWMLTRCASCRMQSGGEDI
jgi:hypothetical protein